MENKAGWLERELGGGSKAASVGELVDAACGHFSDLASVVSDVRSQGQSRRDLEAPALPLITRNERLTWSQAPYRPLARRK
jgi:hypothetical protein